MKTTRTISGYNLQVGVSGNGTKVYISKCKDFGFYFSTHNSYLDVIPSIEIVTETLKRLESKKGYPQYDIPSGFVLDDYSNWKVTKIIKEQVSISYKEGREDSMLNRALGKLSEDEILLVSKFFTKDN